MKESKVIKPTTENQNPLNGSIKIFLAGSIEMGNASNWQKEIIDKFEKDVTELVTVSNDEFTLLKECLDISFTGIHK